MSSTDPRIAAFRTSVEGDEREAEAYAAAFDWADAKAGVVRINFRDPDQAMVERVAKHLCDRKNRMLLDDGPRYSWRQFEREARGILAALAAPEDTDSVWPFTTNGCREDTT